MKSTRLPSPCDLGCQEHSVSKSILSSVLSRTRAHHTGKTHVGLVVNLGHLESRISVESARVQARNAVCQAREGLRTSAQQRGLHLEDLRDAETQSAGVAISFSRISRQLLAQKNIREERESSQNAGRPPDERRLATGTDPARPSQRA
jgi:hypothetical protein